MKIGTQTKDCCFLTVRNQKVLQEIKKSFEDVHFEEKSVKIHLPHYEILPLHSQLVQLVYSGHLHT